MQKSFDRQCAKYYHARLMSNEMIIDSVSFARTSKSLQGKIALGALTRARDYFIATDGEIVFQLHGSLDQRKQPQLILTLSGDVMLTCQRCLQPLSHRLESTRGLKLVKDDAALPPLDEEQDDIDVIVADPRLNVLELIEDEIILSIPLGPKHDFECRADSAKIPVHENQRQPFAALAKFKQ